jgi:hypothetical protein
MQQFIQLLPSPEEARIIRTALYEYMEKRKADPKPEDEDVCWKYIAKISSELRKEEARYGR